MKDWRPINIYPYLDIVHRHRRGALAVLAIGLFITVFLLRVLPNVYESTAVIAIEPAQIAADYIEPGASPSRDKSNVSDQLGALAHQAFSKERLAHLVKLFGLYGYRTGQPLDRFVALFERNIDLVVSQDAITYESSHNQGDPDVLRISFQYTDRATAQKVTAALADNYIEEGYRERIQRAEEATKFLATQVAQESSRLEAKSSELKELERRYQGSLPEELDANLGEISRLESQVNTINQQIALDRAMPVAGGQSVSLSPEQELRRLQIQLTQLRAQYSDQYPDVIQLRQQIADLKQQIKEAPANVEANSDSNLAGDRLQRQAAALEGQIEAIKARVVATPVHGQELAAVRRDYDALAIEYQSLLGKQRAAQLRESVERRHQDDRLRLLEPANVPQKAIRPNRPVFFVEGILFSVIAALALPFGLYFTDTSFKDADELANEFGIAVASVIPAIESRAERSVAILRMVAISSAGIMVSAAVIWAYANNLF